MHDIQAPSTNIICSSMLSLVSIVFLFPSESIIPIALFTLASVVIIGHFSVYGIPGTFIIPCMSSIYDIPVPSMVFLYPAVSMANISPSVDWYPFSIQHRYSLLVPYNILVSSIASGPPVLPTLYPTSSYAVFCPFVSLFPLV